MATQYQWKQFCDAMAMGRVGPYQQKNSVSGENCIRDYSSAGKIVASMKVLGGNSNKLGQECIREFFVLKDILHKCADIYQITDAEWYEWDNARDDFHDEKWLLERRRV